MPKFRKKPVVIEAMQYTGENYHDLVRWKDGFETHNDRAFYNFDSFMLIDTLEGRMEAQPDDWIIRGVKGEFYPCKPDIFAETYEPVEEESNG